jgi:hypothetical protein
LTLPHSNGIVEGKVNKLKFLIRTIISKKRSRRAGVLQAASLNQRETRFIPKFTWGKMLVPQKREEEIVITLHEPLEHHHAK